MLAVISESILFPTNVSFILMPASHFSLFLNPGIPLSSKWVVTDDKSTS